MRAELPLFDPEDRLFLMALFTELERLEAPPEVRLTCPALMLRWSTVSGTAPHITEYIAGLLRDGPLRDMLVAAEYRVPTRDSALEEDFRGRATLNMTDWSITITDRFSCTATYHLKGGPDDAANTPL